MKTYLIIGQADNAHLENVVIATSQEEAIDLWKKYHKDAGWEDAEWRRLCDLPDPATYTLSYVYSIDDLTGLEN